MLWYRYFLIHDSKNNNFDYTGDSAPRLIYRFALSQT